MRSLIQVCAALGVAWFGVSPEAASEEACYDVAVVGRIVDASNFLPLDQFYPDLDPNGDVYLGGRIDVRVRVSRVLEGDNVPHTLDARAIMTSLPTRQAVLVFYLKRRDQSPYQAIDWGFAERDARGRYAARGDETPPARCH